jgi:PAS domain S-box-containing protein
MNRLSGLLKEKNLLITGIGLACLLMLGIGMLAYRYEERIIKEEKYLELKAIADLKINQIQTWKMERLNDAESLSRDRYIAAAVNDIETNAPDKQDQIKYLYDELGKIQKEYKYTSIDFIDLDGETVFSLKDPNRTLHPEIWRVGLDVIKTGKSKITDFYTCNTCEHAYISVLAPILDDNRKVIGFINQEVDASTYLFPLLETWPMPSRSAETLMVEKSGDQVLFINRLKFAADQPLHFTLSLNESQLPAVQAILGKTGYTEGSDYRGVNVVAYITPVDGTPWFLVSKIDQRELFADLYYHTWVIIGVVLLLCTLIIMAGVVVTNYRQKKIFRNLLEVESDREKFKEFFRATLYSIGDALVITDMDGRISRMNTRAEELSGWKEFQAVSLPFSQIFEIIDEHSYPIMGELVGSDMSGKGYTGKGNLKTRDGREYPVIITSSPIEMSDQKTAGIVLVIKEMSHEEELQQTILSQQEDYMLLFDHMEQGFALCEIIPDDQGKPYDYQFLKVNPAYERLTGLIQQDLIRSTARKCVPGISQFWIDTYGRVAHTGVSTMLEYKNPDTGNIFEMNIFSPKTGQFATLITDITERRQQEDTIKKSEAKFRSRSRELEVLYTLSTLMREAVCEEDILPIVLHEVSDIIPCDTAELILYYPTDQVFTIKAASGLLAQVEGMSFDLDRGLTGEVLQSRSPKIVDDYQAFSNNMPDLPQITDLGPTMAVPMQDRNDLIGVILIGRRRRENAKPFNEDELRLLSAIAELAGNSIHRVRMDQIAHKHLVRTQELHQIDTTISTSFDMPMVIKFILEKTCSLLDVDAADMLIVNQSTLSLQVYGSAGFHNPPDIKKVRISMRHSLAKDVVLNQKSVNIPNLEEEPIWIQENPILKQEGFLAYYATPIFVKGALIGVLEVFSRSVKQVDRDWMEFFETLAGQASLAVDNLTQFSQLQQNNVKLKVSFDSILDSWANSIDLHNHEPPGTSKQIAELCSSLAGRIGISDEKIIPLSRAALLHDIGELSLPDSIMQKKGALTAKDRSIMEQHPLIGCDLLEKVDDLRGSLSAIRSHHEKWDGSGYPEQLKEQQIPTSARILALVDVWYALIHDRPWRKAWNRDKAIEYILAQKGISFDPQVVNAFMDLLVDFPQLFG